MRFFSKARNTARRAPADLARFGFGFETGNQGRPPAPGQGRADRRGGGPFCRPGAVLLPADASAPAVAPPAGIPKKFLTNYARDLFHSAGHCPPDHCPVSGTGRTLDAKLPGHHEGRGKAAVRYTLLRTTAGKRETNVLTVAGSGPRRSRAGARPCCPSGRPHLFAGSIPAWPALTAFFHRTRRAARRRGGLRDRLGRPATTFVVFISKGEPGLLRTPGSGRRGR